MRDFLTHSLYDCNPMVSTRTCIDVDDLGRGIVFYTQALGLQVKRRLDDDWVELGGAGHPIDLIRNAAGSTPTPDDQVARRYDRHWTPVHLDFVVDDIAATVERCVSNGAKLERAIVEKTFGKIAVLADPFGHGFCVIEFKGRGYDEILSPT